MGTEETVAITENGDLLILDGREYSSPLNSSVSFSVSGLKIHWRAGYDVKDNRVEPGTSSLSGIGHLSRDRLAIIGDTDNQTQELAVSLHTADLSNWKTPKGKIGHTVVLGFSKADIELRSQDCWWIEVYFPSETIERIITASRAGTLKSLTILVRFADNNLFIEPRKNFGRMFWDVRDIFLRPNKQTGAIANPECAFGYEASAHLVELAESVSEAKDNDASQRRQPEVTAAPEADLNPECAFGQQASAHLVELPERISEAKDKEVSQQRQPEVTVAPEADLKSTDIRALVSTIKMFGWIFVLLALLALVFK